MTETVRRWREILSRPAHPRVLPLPHPSWRNNGWLKRNPWFEGETLPRISRTDVALRFGYVQNPAHSLR